MRRRKTNREKENKKRSSCTYSKRNNFLLRNSRAPRRLFGWAGLSFSIKHGHRKTYDKLGTSSVAMTWMTKMETTARRIFYSIQRPNHTERCGWHYVLRSFFLLYLQQQQRPLHQFVLFKSKTLSLSTLIISLVSTSFTSFRFDSDEREEEIERETKTERDLCAGIIKSRSYCLRKTNSFSIFTKLWKRDIFAKHLMPIDCEQFTVEVAQMNA